MSLRHASLFSQLLQHIPRSEFQHLVRKHDAEKSAKGFTCWTQFVSMLFCHLAWADSLREICNGLACLKGKLSHLGVSKAPNKSTLSYANEHRPAALYQDIFWAAANRMRAGGGLGERKKKFRFKNKLMSFDSTTITLCLGLFPWADYRRAKGGVKVHVLLDHDDYMPAYVHVTEARPHDRVAAGALKLNAGSIVAFDRAYNDYKLFAKWTEEGVFFVTRMKKDADYEVDEERAVAKNSNILSNEIIYFSSAASWNKCPYLLRRIVVWDAENAREIVLLTNHLEFGATTIAAIYKDRWEIELFFKALKQNLKIKTFVGTSENALLIQIWTALIALLLLRWMHYLSHASWSFSNMVAMLRMNLLVYRDLLDWLRAPFGQPPPSEDDGAGVQLEIPLAGFGQPMLT